MQPLEIADLDFSIPQTGEPTLPSPLRRTTFVPDSQRVSYFTDLSLLAQVQAAGKPLPAFEHAGPRAKIFHDPTWTRAGIVTCGGLCPGLNNVIKTLVTTLYHSYGVDNVYGIRNGYRGLNPEYGLEPVHLDPDIVDTIHESGGSILGSSRGAQDVELMIRTLDRLRLNILFTIGGDGTQRGAWELAQAARARNLPMSIVGIPKTIDNDIDFMDQTFGFGSAVAAASPIISCAHAECKGAVNGVSIIRIMGRDSGFIAAHASLSNPVVNFCLVPEVPFQLDGAEGLLAALERRLARKEHAVIMVAEGAGQDLLPKNAEKRDASGNVLHQDIGTFLRDRVHDYLGTRGIEHAIRYFDPSYLIRGIPAQGNDAIFCLHLAENAVHAAMAGRTGMVAGHWHGHFTHVPMTLATRQRKRIDPASQLWNSVLAVTQQEKWMTSGTAQA